MYNLNGKKVLNSDVQIGNNPSYVKLNAISADNPLIDVSGNSKSVAYLDYLAGISTMAYDFKKFFITGALYNFSSWQSSQVRSYIGYSQSEFDDSTYSASLTNDYSSMCAVSVVHGVPTFTITNSTQSAITINQIRLGAQLTENSSGTKMNIIFAGFNLGEITIAPNDSYSFTITNI